MSADVFVHGDELIWNCHWLILASEYPADRWFPKESSEFQRVCCKMMHDFYLSIFTYVHVDVK